MSRKIIWWVGMSSVSICFVLRLLLADIVELNDFLQSVQIAGLGMALASYGHPVVDKIEDAEEEIREEYEEEEE